MTPTRVSALPICGGAQDSTDRHCQGHTLVDIHPGLRTEQNARRARCRPTSGVTGCFPDTSYAHLAGVAGYPFSPRGPGWRGPGTHLRRWRGLFHSQAVGKACWGLRRRPQRPQGCHPAGQPGPRAAGTCAGPATTGGTARSVPGTSPPAPAPCTAERYTQPVSGRREVGTRVGERRVRVRISVRVCACVWRAPASLHVETHRTKLPTQPGRWPSSFPG